MSTFDSGVIFIYLLITIIVGMYAGRNVKTMTDFAVGKRDFLIFTLIMTIIATYIDGESILNGVTLSYKSGLSYYIANISSTITLFLYSAIAIRVTKFENAISVGDIMGELYGKFAQIFTGISGFLISAALVAAQFKAMSFVFDYFYGVDSVTGVLIGAFIIIAYSAFGGIRAVTWTDLVQFFILICAVPLVTSIAINKVGGISEIFHQLPSDKLTFFAEDDETFYKHIVYFVAFAMPLCSPPMIQRMLMTKDMKRSFKAYWMSAAICIPLYIMISLAGVAAFVMDPNLDPNNVFMYLIDTGMPSGLKGFAVAGIIAIIMSTADSFMNTAAISFSHDFIKTIYPQRFSDTDELRLTKLVTLIIGFLACVIALRFSNLLDIMFYSFVLWGPVVTIPLLLGLFGVKSPRYAFYVAMGGGIAASVIWTIFDLENKTYIHSLLPALLANFMFFVGSIIYGKCSSNKASEAIS